VGHVEEEDIKMFVSPPSLILRRTWTIRLLVLLLLLPFGLLALWGVIATVTSKPPDPVGAAMCAVLAVGLLLPFILIFRRESGRETRIHEEGIAQIVGSRTTELRWDAIREVWFHAVRVQAGGLVGAAVGAAIRAASKKNARLDPNTTSITVRLIGEDGAKLKVTSNDKGVVAAFEVVLSRVNPRLVAEGKRLVQQGQVASFGPLSISIRGVAAGRKEPTAFVEIETLGIKNGKLRLKKRGSWLDTFAIRIKDIPNVFAFLELYQQLSVSQTGGKPGVDANLAGGSTFL